MRSRRRAPLWAARCRISPPFCEFNNAGSISRRAVIMSVLDLDGREVEN
jgi:hypothetical protein